MAIPTQFSVANTNIAPIANPPLAKDLPKVIEAEEHSLVDGASIIPSLSSVGVSTPQELTAETAVVIANPSAKTAQIKPSVDVPIEKTAQAKATVSAPVEKTAESKAAVGAPVEKTAQTKTINPAPSVLTPKTGTLTAPPFPLNHARVLYNNLLPLTTVTSSGGFNPENTVIPNTWQRWTTNTGVVSSFTITYTFLTPRNVDTICIGAHNVFGNGTDFTWRAEFSQDGGATWSLLSPVQNPTTSAPLMFHRSTIALCDAVRISCTNVIGNLYIGYVSAGIALQMQRPFFNGHRPFTDSDVTEYYANRTESGERIGRQIRRKGFETSFEWSNLDDGWYRQYIPEFKEYAKRVPVFLAWNLLEYPEDVAFGDITEDFGSSMQNGTATKRSGLSFTIAGVG